MTTLIGTGQNPRYPAGQEFDVPDTDQDQIDELVGAGDATLKDPEGEDPEQEA